MLTDQPILGMSKLTQALLNSIDYNGVKRRRRANYLRLDNELSKFNIIKLPIDNYMVPMVYPFLTKYTGLKQKLIAEGIYVATYWPNVYGWVESSSVEFRFAEYLVPLPVDQRLGQKELSYMINKIMRICT